MYWKKRYLGLMAGQGLTPNWMLLARTQQVRLPRQRRATSLQGAVQQPGMSAQAVGTLLAWCTAVWSALACCAALLPLITNAVMWTLHKVPARWRAWRPAPVRVAGAAAAGDLAVKGSLDGGDDLARRAAHRGPRALGSAHAPEALCRPSSVDGA